MNNTPSTIKLPQSDFLAGAAIYSGSMGDSQTVKTMGDRIRVRIAEINVSQSDVARKVGITQSALSHLMTGRSRNSVHLPAIARALSVDLDWLIGDEESEPIGIVRSPGSHYLPEPSSLDHPDMVLIPQLTIGYSMGGGTVFEEYQQTALIPFARDWLKPLMRGSFDQLFVARGDGDSMQPTLLDGDLVVVDTAQKTIDRQDGIWCLSYGDFGMIKRVRMLPDGGAQINSDNPSVTPITAYDGEMHVVGRVVWIMRRI